MVIHEPLDLQYWLVNTLSGSWSIFWFVAMFIIAILSARFKMNNITFVFILAIFALLMAPFAEWFIILYCILGGFVIYYAISKIIGH